MNRKGFTIIELLLVTVLLIVVGVVFWTQKNNIEVAARDDSRKQSINAIYYGLEKVYYPTNSNYPKELSAETLPGLNKSVFLDPNGVAVGTSGSDFRYEGTNCDNDACKSYDMRADLENEKDFTKSSVNK